jgi:hypothetical protein
MATDAAEQRLQGFILCVASDTGVPEAAEEQMPGPNQRRSADCFTAVLIGDGRVRVKSSARAGGLLAGVTRLWCGVGGPCGPAVGLDRGGLPVTPAGLWDLSPFYSLAAGT